MGAYSVKGALLGSCDEGLVVDIDVCVGDVSGTSTPVTGVVTPQDVAETKGLGDGADTVVDVAIGRLSESEEEKTGSKRRDARASRSA